MSDPIVGIDLGTTNSEVAIIEDGQVLVLEVENGSELLPSVVGLDQDGKLLVGSAARNQYALYPERTIRSIKRLMGSDTTVDLGEQSYHPQEVSAMILRRLKEVAGEHLGCEVRKAVITVPAYFSDAQRQATREAGEIAGLEVTRIINEPTAAALAYESEHQGRKRILVYDLGGGTFDVSVVSVEDNVVEVLASHGDNQLGGDDFDQKIIDFVVDHIREQYALELKDHHQAMARVLRAAEGAKIVLSDAPYVRIEEEYLLDQDGAPINLSVELARNDYEEMIEPFVAETLLAVHTALEGAGLTVSDLDEVLLVGGSTRTPMVAERLERELGLQPRGDVDPELCVATGAAIQAALLAGQSVTTVLVDITPYTFGTAVLDEMDGIPYPYCFVPLIRKNTPIPVTKSEAFSTSHDDQTEIMVNVYQGEDQDALNNTEIGKFTVEGLREVPRGNKIVITFSLDLNGILSVTAKEKDTGLEKGITIDNAISRFEAEELDTARQRMDALFGDEQVVDVEAEVPARQRHSRAVVQARALVEKAERMLEQASTEDREDLVDLIEGVNDAIAADDDQALETAGAELSDVLYYLES